MKTGAERIAVERARQIESEGWTSEHDAKHPSGVIETAASCYLEHAIKQIAKSENPTRAPEKWPWDRNWWKPSQDPVRNLEKAGALIAAAIDRETSCHVEDGFDFSLEEIGTLHRNGIGVRISDDVLTLTSDGFDLSEDVGIKPGPGGLEEALLKAIQRASGTRGLGVLANAKRKLDDARSKFHEEKQKYDALERLVSYANRT